MACLYMAATDITPCYSEKDDAREVTYIWTNARVDYSLKTSRGTLVEMVWRPKWGLSCYMDGCIQSCEMDEALYHEELVQPLFLDTFIVARKACILGGGEGATAREVFKCPQIDEVNMIEWDRDVVRLFRNKYPQWARGAWRDDRLIIEYKDAFVACQEKRHYDIVIVDLFDPYDWNTWAFLISHVAKWATIGVSIYCGMDDIYVKRFNTGGEDMSYAHRTKCLLQTIGFKRSTVRKKYIPSFNGEAVFLHAFRS